jgi:hypothetical protein
MDLSRGLGDVYKRQAPNSLLQHMHKVKIFITRHLLQERFQLSAHSVIR